MKKILAITAILMISGFALLAQAPPVPPTNAGTGGGPVGGGGAPIGSGLEILIASGLVYMMSKFKRSVRRTKIISIAVLLVLISGSGLYATNQVVTNNGDAGAGSLRQAITDVSDGETITFNLTTGNEIIVLSSELLISDKGFSINGTNTAGGGTQITVQVTTPGTSPYRVFHFNALGKTSTIRNLSIKGGKFTGTGSYGGGIFLEQGALNLSHVTVSGSQAYNGGGIALYAPTSCTFDYVTVSNCTGTMGGGLYCGADNNLTLNNCQFTGNTTTDPVPSKTPKSSGGHGGGICNYGTMAVNYCEISDNHGAGDYSIFGIGIHNSGMMTILSSVVKNNSYTGTKGALGGGIGVYSEDADVTCIIENSTISGNNINSTINEGVMGAGIVFFGGNVTGIIINCTVSENTVTAPSMALGGGVCVVLASVAISNSTIANNAASEAGAGICQVAGTLAIKNTIMAQNSDNNTKFDYNAYTAYGPCTLNDNGNNIVQYQNVAASEANSFNAATDLLYNTKYNTAGTAFSSWTKGGDPNGGSLNLANAVADNGGPTKTLAITPGSLAIHAGAWDDAVTLDQRGISRHLDTPAIGAFELSPAPGYWTGALTQNWGHTENWEDGNLPGPSDNVTISGAGGMYPRLSSSGECNDLNIPNYASVRVYDGGSLTVNGTLLNNYGNFGLVINSNSFGTGSLLHNTSNVPATINRYISGSSSLTANKYHFVSIPTQYASPTSNLFLDSYLYKLDPTQQINPPTNPAYGKWVSMGNSTTTPLYTNQGYMIYFPGDFQIYTFSGNLNNGTYNYSLTGHSGANIYTFNLVPNPYPSSIIWNTADAAKWPTSTGIGGVCYIWNDGNYANISSGDLSYIPVGQAFMVLVTNEASPTLSVSNAARTHSSQAFYKSGDIENQLTITASANNYSDKTVVTFAQEATENFDLQIDGLKINGLEEAPQLFTLSGETKYSINNLPLFEDQRTIDMNFETQFTGQVMLNFEGMESFDPSINIYLKDELTNQTINLRNQPVYTFNHNPENDASRFKLVFGGTIGIEEPASLKGILWIAGNTLYINTPKLSGQTGMIEVYNASGQMLMSKTMVLSGLSSLELNFKGFVVARLTAGNEVMTVKGILMK
jgi:hypothetical protein